MLPVKIDNLSSYLEPPTGYSFDNAVITTYSLHLDILLTIPMFLDGALSNEDAIMKNYQMVVEMIDRYKAKIQVFVQKGEIKSSASASKKSSKMYELLRGIITEVTTDKHHSFHPKFWFIRYKNPITKDYKYRFIVLSKNLTNSSDLDIAVVFDSTNSINNSQHKEINSKIYKFLKTTLKNDFFTEEELINIEWENIDEFKLSNIYFKGDKNDQELYQTNTINSDAIIFSPFVSNKIFAKGNGNILITREDEVDEKTKVGGGIYKIDDSINDNIEDNESKLDLFDGDDKDETEENNELINQLHAKAYIYKKIPPNASQEVTYLAIGSTNATNRGFEQNYEVLVELKGKQTLFKNIKDYLENKKNKKIPFIIFTPKEKSKEQEEKQKIQEELDEVKQNLIDKEIISKYEPSVKTISLDFVQLELNFGIKLYITPASFNSKIEFHNVDNLSWILTQDSQITGWFKFILTKSGFSREFLIDTKLDMEETKYLEAIKSEAANYSDKYFFNNIDTLLKNGKVALGQTIERSKNEDKDMEQCYSKKSLENGRVDLLLDTYATDKELFLRVIDLLATKKASAIKDEKALQQQKEINKILKIFKGIDK